MITGEDIQRCEDEKQGVKLVVVDTQQFFEFEIPVHLDAENYINSAECRALCAALILTIDLVIDHICTEYDSVNKEWIDD